MYIRRYAPLKMHHTFLAYLIQSLPYITCKCVYLSLLGMFPRTPQHISA